MIMKISCLFRLTLAVVFNEKGFPIWHAQLYSSGKYPIIIYTDPVRALVVKYKNTIDAGDDFSSRCRIQSSNGLNIVLTDEGKKWSSDYYKLKFG